MENIIKENELVKKWEPILEHADLPKIQDTHRKEVTAILLENQENNKHLHEATPTNVTGGVSKWDPVLMGLVRRAMPSMIAFDIAGVQPMTLPTGLIFALRSKYTNQAGAEALFSEALSSFSGQGTQSAGMFAGVKVATTALSTNVTVVDTSDLAPGMLVYGNGIPADTVIASITSGTVFVLSAAATAAAAGVNLAFAASSGTGLATATGEGDIAAQMGVSIEKISVTAITRALKAEYSTELAQDMQAVHGLDAETELANILSSEIISELNREFLRTLYAQAKLGSTQNTVTPGQFDLTADADGRWSAERFKGLHFAIERDANAIATDTRRGKGNVLVCSADVASALSMANILSTVNMDMSVNSDWTNSTYVGNIGQMKVYVDPYAAANFFMVGYKGANKMDAGYFYCPYVPLQMYRATDPASFQPKIAFKTRYSKVANPFYQGGTRTNGYYRISAVKNLI
jgi:Major capsid protein Gp23